MSNTAQVASQYNLNSALEHLRLIENRLEYAVTLQVIRETISSISGSEKLRIADIGGGTGRYAVELAKLGHSVTLSDISGNELEIAREFAKSEGVELEDIVRADAKDLRDTFAGFKEGGYDLILLLGPLYHLIEEEERLGALRDCAAMLRSGGVVIVAFVTRFAHFRDLASKDPGRLLREKGFYGGYERDGRYVREGKVGYHVGGVQEVKGLFEKVGELDVRRIVGCEGFLGGLGSRGLNGLGEKDWNAWLGMVMRSAEEEWVLGASDHIIVIAGTL